LFPVIESVHLCGLALLVGTILLIDLRMLGVGRHREKAPELASRLAPWTRAGMAVMFVTGPLMFASDISRYLANPAFRVKMLLLLIALASHFTLHRKAVRTGEGRLAAILSMALWSGVVLGGRAIADFDL
jgi:hypothetical protein